jgi:parvulin-like peptidyl-prolyl isomerase
MKFFVVFFALAAALFVAPRANAQEPELVSEIVARVNNDIITKVDYNNAVKDFREALTAQLGKEGKGPADIAAEFERLKPTILNLMIENLLLEQKAKELNFDAESEVNQRMGDLAKQNGFKSALEFEKALREQGIDPDLARGQIRRESQQEYVMQREVLQPIFHRLTEKDKRDFYDRNKAGFTVPGEVTISEIFVALEGHTADEVEQRARRIIAEVRAGLSFADAAQKNSPANRASRAQGGKMGTFKAGELNEAITAAISTLKVGEVTEPIRQQDGFLIIRVDDRKEATVRPFESPEVQNAIGRCATMERAEQERKKYLKKLRDEAFVEVNKDYAPTQAKSDKDEKAEKN